MSETENIINVLGNLIDKMSLMFSNIENRLSKIESDNMRDLSVIKDSLDSIKESALTCSCSSSTITHSDHLSLGEADPGVEQEVLHDPDLPSLKPTLTQQALGLVLSDSDLTLEQSRHLIKSIYQS